MELVIDNRENIKTDFNNQDTLKYDNLTHKMDDFSRDKCKLQ